MDNIEYGSLFENEHPTKWKDVTRAERQALADAYAEYGTAGISTVLRGLELSIPVNTVRGKMIQAGIRVKTLEFADSAPIPRKYNIEIPQETVKAVFVGDEQGIFRDRDLCSRVLEFISDFQPDLLVDLGDSIDHYSISRFDKDPRRQLSLEIELEDAKDYFIDLDVAAPMYAKKLWLKGNHEKRWNDYIVKNAPQIAFMLGRELSLERAVGVDALGWETFEYGSMVDFRGFTMTHGTFTGPTAAEKAAKAMGGSGIQGHDHMPNMHHWSDMNGPHLWVINPTLMRIDATSPDYINGIVNWAQGFTYAHFIGNRWTLTQVIADLDGHFIAEGKRY